MLSRVKARRLRGVWLRFLEALRLYVASGFEIHYSWREARARVGMATIPPSLDSSIPDLPADHALWLQILREAVRQGAPLSDVLSAFRGALQEEHRRDWEHFLRGLPTRVNLVLILFFFPAFFCLLFIPLIVLLTN